MAKPSKSEETAAFEGFADEKMKFFRALAKHQDRVWFLEHKAEYDGGWAGPMKALLEEARKGVDRVYPDCEIEPPKVFRINRDVRFSADKAPYKTQVSGLLGIKQGAAATMETPAALYVQLGLESMAAAGQYAMSTEVLARYRAAVLDPKRGAELGKLTLALEKKGFRLTAAETLKKAPRGFDPEHPRVELLKKKGLVAMFPPIPEGIIQSRAFLAWVVGQAKLTAPLVRWLVYATA